MANITQTMNTTEVEYISIYGKPKLPSGKPKGTRKFTDEEKLERRRKTNMRCFYTNHEYYKLYNRLNKEATRKAEKSQD